ncbi:hypothetical protein QOZ84_00295 [Romboutsia sedimentorum]|uniref:Uncharacterized protein n=1 Tax=Romboutsia sedimentorum TaxID=1368474 RepID=A0ABT7E4X7_9FIRM|nr:hypothetical protein [Romboutsia sedimentorum]MDK2561971.1 hypothetical protein [Romboutsia sedimentorum]MDK2586763.1 hypothetical protein [Romboutsia sedimentorum]
MKCCSYKNGVIVEISNSSNSDYKYITIAKDINDIYTFIRLVYSKETIILNCEYNEISVDDLNIGDFVFVYHSNIMTMSIPPQSVAYIIEVK